jgi:hypothetical protein
MVMSQHDRNKRRALLVRRQAARRIGQAQREIWKQRKAAQGEELDDVVPDGDDLFAELPDSLLG